MNKRNFIKSSLLMVAGTLLTSVKVMSESKQKPKAPGIIYSEADQGKWDGKSGSHAPVVKVEGSQVTLTTEHGMSDKHYIVRHTLVTEKGEVVGAKTFKPTDEKAVSTFSVDGHHGKLVATSFCNLHDLWVTEFSV